MLQAAWPATWSRRETSPPTSSLYSRRQSFLRSGDNSPDVSFLLCFLFLLLSGQQQSRWITSRPSLRRSSYTPGVKRSKWGQRWYLLVERQREEKEGETTWLTMWFPNSTSIRATINITAPPYCWVGREKYHSLYNHNSHCFWRDHTLALYPGLGMRLTTNVYVLHSQVCLLL